LEKIQQWQYDCCPGRVRPNTAQTTAEINKIKDLEQTLSISVLAHQNVTSQKHLDALFTYNRLKVTVWALAIAYSAAYMSQTRDQQRFTI